MILADTSAWVEYDRANDSPLHLHLTALIDESAEDVAVTEPVLMEVLAGARNERRYQRLFNRLTSLGWLPVDPVTDFTGAARIYRVCRANGFTPRGLTDCMIANIALRTESEILTADQDFYRMAELLPLRIVTVS